MPDVILDVFVSGRASPAEVSNTQPSILRQIELQAAHYPRYNALATLSSNPPPRTPPPVVASQTKAGNNFDRTYNKINRSLSTPSVAIAPQSDAKQLVLRNVKETIRRATAYVDLRGLYNKSNEPPQDFSKALECYLRHLRQGPTHALFSVNRLFLKGRGGVSQDASVTASWFLKAATRSHVPAQPHIGVLYESSQGVP